MKNLRVVSITAIAALSLAIASCSTEQTSSKQASSASTNSALAQVDSAQFPVTINHALGSTTIEKAPQRIATVGWANHEVPLALGIVPVGMSKATWGDDDNDGVLPWTEEKLKELGAETPVLFDETDSIPFETIANTKSDVILASYSGMTQEDYDQLSKIAPVVAYPGIPWGTSMNQMIEMNSKAIGLEKKGTELSDSLTKTIEDSLGKHPELKDSKVMFSSFGNDDLSKVSFYTTHDARASFLKEVGIGVPKAVGEASASSSAFFAELSAENPEAFDDVDLIVTYGSDNAEENKANLAKLQADPLLGRIPAIRDGKVAFLGNSPQAAAANPSPLSIGWGIDTYFTNLAQALKGA